MQVIKKLGKGWKHHFQVKHRPRTFRFGHQFEYAHWVSGWPNIKLTIYFWRKTYSLWFYKMGED